jgi:hypothetical protein
LRNLPGAVPVFSKEPGEYHQLVSRKRLAVVDAGMRYATKVKRPDAVRARRRSQVAETRKLVA